MTDKILKLLSSRWRPFIMMGIYLTSSVVSIVTLIWLFHLMKSIG